MDEKFYIATLTFKIFSAILCITMIIMFILPNIFNLNPLIVNESRLSTFSPDSKCLYIDTYLIHVRGPYWHSKKLIKRTAPRKNKWKSLTSVVELSSLYQTDCLALSLDGDGLSNNTALLISRITFHESLASLLRSTGYISITATPPLK